MPRVSSTCSVATLLSAHLLGAYAARFSIASVFSNGMVLQRDVPVTIWGWGAPGAAVYSALLQTPNNTALWATSTADSTGLWRAEFPAQPYTPAWGPTFYQFYASTAPLSLPCMTNSPVSCNGTTANLWQLLFGDVILCSGQSNMQVTVSFAFNASSEEQQASDQWGGAAYIMQVGGATSDGSEPLEDFPIRPSIPWSVAANTTLPGFSATCWYTAKAVLEQRAASPFPDAWAVPLGLIASSWGGTPIRAWASPAVWGACESLYPYPPSVPMGPSPSSPSTLHNAMLAPFAVGPLRVSSVVWFQGETDTSEFWYNSNASYPYYSCMLSGLAADLRAALDSPGVAWVTVQLAPFLGGSELPLFRDMQCRVTRTLPNASCAVIDDDGDPLSPIGSVHSRNKQLVGRRVAPSILASLYGPALLQARGPHYASAAPGLPDPTGSWLYANVSLAPGQTGGALDLSWVPPHVNAWQNSSRCPTDIGNVTAADCAWFDVLGSDGRFYNATLVTLAGAGALTLAAPVEPPVAGIVPVGTRFGWGQFPVVNVYDSAGFPLEPWAANFSAPRTGVCFAFGHGVAKEVAAAASWYRRAANGNHTVAQSNLASCYEWGLGVQKDTVQAVVWWRRAADAGYPLAQHCLGVAYQQGIGVTSDLTCSVAWYRRAAEAGFADSQNNLGVCYQRGMGVPMNLARAAEWFRREAEGGCAGAQCALGQCFAQGMGVRADASAAVAWFTRAAESGYTDAQFNLGSIYMKGRGVAADPATAVVWWRRAADAGDAESQFNLSRCYEDGCGVLRNAATASMWRGRAAAAGFFGPH